MRVRALHIRNFRGFIDLRISPKDNVVALGPPGSGRSDLIVALGRVLDADASRARITTELDFHKRNTTRPIQIGVALTDLGPDLEQHFFDRLEVWDDANHRIVPEVDTPASIDGGDYEWALRLAYRAEWLPEQERCDEWVYYPKDTDPASGSFARTRRPDIEALGFRSLKWRDGRTLDLGARSAFRRVIERTEGGDFAVAVEQYVEDVAQAAAQFTDSSRVKAALNEVIAPIQELLGVDHEDPLRGFRFAPEGGSTSGLLRSLGLSIDLEDGAGGLPTWRRGQR